MADSVAKLQQEILSLTGVDIMLDADNFKSTYQILQEISEVWEDLTDVSRANVLNLLGGKRNANVLSSLITNFQDAEKAATTAANSAGSAWAENEKYLNSIEGKTKQVQAAFETFANGVLNSNLVKVWLDIQKAVLDAGTALNNIGLLLPTIAAGLMTIKGIMDSMKASTAADKIMSYLRAGGTADNENIQNILANLTRGQAGMLLGNLSKTYDTDGVADEIGNIVQQLQASTGAANTFKGALASMGITAKNVFAGIKASLLSSGIAALAGLLVTGLVNGIQWIAQAGQRAIDTANEINEAYHKNTDTYNDNIKKLDSLRTEYDNLNKKAGEHGQQGSLTASEYQRYKDIIQEIVNISPSVASSFSSEGAALKDYTNVINQAIDAQKQLIETEKIALVNNGEKTYKGAAAAMNDVWLEFNKAGHDLYSNLSTKGTFLPWDFAEYSKQISALQSVLHDFGIEISNTTLFDGSGNAFTQFFKDPENFRKLASNIINIRNALSSAQDESGNLIFSGQDVDRIIGKMNVYNDLIQKYDTNTSKVVDTLLAFADTSAEVEFPNKDDMNIDQLNAYRDGIADLADTQKTFAQQKQDVVAYTAAFSSAVAEIQQLREQYGTVGEDGSFGFGDNTDEVIAGLTKLRDTWKSLGAYPAIVAMFDQQIALLSGTTETNVGVTEKAVQSYEKLEKVLSKISGINSFLNKARNGSDDPFGMISSAKELAEAYNEIAALSEGDKIDWTAFAQDTVGPNGEIQWDTTAIEDYIDKIIEAAVSNTEFANSNPGVIEWLKQMAKGFDDAANSAKSLNDAMSSMESIDGIIKRINEYDGDESEAFDIIGELQKFVDEWNKIREEQKLEPIDITTFVSEENGKVSFSNTISALGEFRDAIINDNDAMQELKTTSPGLYNVITTMGTQAVDAASDILTLGDAVSTLSDVVKYMSDGFGNDTLGAISNASKLADAWNQALKDAGKSDEAKKSFRDFISFDVDGNIIEDAEKQAEALRKMYTDIATAAIDLDDTLTLGEKVHLKSAIPTWVEQWLNVDEVQKRVAEIKDAFSEIAAITSYQNDLASYRSGDIEYFDMLEKMYNLASQYEDIDLGDLWNFEAGDFKDIGDIQLDKMLDKLAVELKVSGEEIEGWKTKVKNSFKEAEEAANAYETATKSINLASSLNGFLGDVKSGDKDPLSMLSSAVSLAEDLGLKLEEVVSVGAGGKMTFNTDALTTAFEKYIDDLVTAGSLNKDLAAQINNAARAEGELAEEAKTAAERMADALSNMQSLYSFMQSGTAGDSDILTVLKSAQEQFKAYQDMVKDGLETTPLDIFSFITVDSSGIKENVDTAKKLYADMADQMVNEWIAETKKANAGKSGLTLLTGEEEWANGLTREQAAWFNQIKTQILAHLNDLNAEVEPTVGDIINNLQSLFDFQNKINTGESVDFTTVYDDLEKLKTILGDGTLNLGDIIKWQDGDFQYAFDKAGLLSDKIDEFATKIATDLVDAEIAAGNAMDAALRDDEIARRAESIKASLTGVTNAWSEMNNAISKVKAFQGLKSDYQSYQAGETSFLDMLSSTISIAEDLGISLDDAFSVDSSGELIVNIDTMESGLIGVIDNLEAAGACSATLASQLRDAARAEAEVASKAERLQRASENALAAVSFGNGRERAQQLTYEDYKAMVERDARYAESVEYVNGVLSINRDKYNEVADAIARETAELALQEAAQRQLKIEKYQNILKRTTDLRDDQRKSIEKEIAKLKLEATGYLVLANEIANATNQFERFRATANSSETDTYMDAQSALKMIEDVMYNMESEFYGQFGNERFQEAIKLLINPEFDFENGDVEAEVSKYIDKIRKYFSEGTKDNPQTTRSNMGSFFGDLLENNFAWVDEKGFGHITGTIEDMAEKLGITKDAARAALQQLEMFSQARFDWEEIDPEYANRLAEQQEILNQKAAELQAKAAEAQQKAADLQKAAEEAAKAYDQAKDGQDAQAAEEAKAKADAAKQAADEAAKVAKQAVADAEKATAEATGDTTSEVKNLQQNLEEIASKINDIKTNGIEIPTENAIQSAEDVKAKLQEIYDLVQKIKDAWSVPDGGAGNNNSGPEGSATGSVPVREYPVGVKFIASAGMSDVNYANSDGTLNVQKLAAQFIPEDYDGNVDLTRRVVVPVKMLADVGWTAYDEAGNEVDLSTESGWATLFTNTITAGDIESGYDMKYNQNVVINATPILADGDPLEPDAFYGYIENLVNESMSSGKSIMDLDAGEYNLVLSVDVVDEGDDVEAAIDEYGGWAQELHEMQEDWDTIRFNNNFFGEAETLDPHGVLQSLEGDITSTKESLENLSNTGTEGVDVDTSKGEEHLGNLAAEAGDASDAIRNISRNRVTVSVSSAIQSLEAIIDKANSAKAALDNLSRASMPSGSPGNKSGKETTRSGKAGAAGIPSSAGGRTLVGELGREMVVDVDSGRWYTVGNHGPEFVNLPKRAIVYSNDRTEELLGTKPLRVRGISMAAGNAGTGNNSSVVGGGKINVGALTSSVEETRKSSSRTAAATEEVAEEAENVLDTIKDKFDQIIGLLEHQIEHAEFEYFHQERALDYRGMINSLSGEAEIYRRIYEEAMKGVEELVAAGATDADEQVQELEETAWDAYRSMKESIDNARELIKDALEEEVDDIQKAYKTLLDAADEYNDGGKISIDTFQNLMDNGLEYLNLLQEENGSLTVNKDAVNNLTNARKEQLAIETALSYVSRLREALQEGETETVKSLVDSTNDLSGSTWGMVYANLALAKSEGLTQAQYDTALKNIDNLRKLTAIATDDITESLEDRAGTLKDAFEKLNQEIDHYIAHQEQAYREGERAWNFDKMETALQNEVSYYRRAATEAQNAIHEMERLGLDDTNESLQAMEEALWSATNSMYDTVDKLRALRVDALGDEIDKLSNAYGTLKTASEEYSESGKMSVGTFQSILENGVQYLTLLEKENGQYVISKDRIQEYIQARKEQLAIETALKYISEVREAAENGETERVARLVDATNGLSKGTWDLVYAQAALLKETGLSSEQYNRVLENINALRDLAQNVETDLTKAEEDITEAYQDQIDALDDILKYTEDLIRAETKDHIDAIKKEIEAYKEIIQLKKDSLKQTKEESDYQDEVADKVKEIAQLQARADLLALDTSRAANAERQKLLQDIQNKQDELGKYQADHAYDAQVEALDKEAEAYEESRQEEIETLEASISSEEKVYQLAIARIREQWDTLYQDLIAWNTEQGSVINQEITDAWNSALKAVEKYGSYLAALSGLQADLSGANANGQLVVADIPKYHGGGVAGDKGKINDEEVLAVLQKGELVVDKEQKKGLYAVVDFVKSLGERLGTKIGSLANLGMTGQMMPAFAGMAEPSSAGFVENNNITFNPSFNVNINGEVGDQASAREYGRTLAQTAADSLFDAFNRRGINIVQTLRQ